MGLNYPTLPVYACQQGGTNGEGWPSIHTLWMVVRCAPRCIEKTWGHPSPANSINCGIIIEDIYLSEILLLSICHQLEEEALPGSCGSKDIHLSSTHAIEPLGNYGIGYWIPYGLKYHQEWGVNSPLVKCVLWLLLSDNSTMGRQEREMYLEEEHSGS